MEVASTSSTLCYVPDPRSSPARLYKSTPLILNLNRRTMDLPSVSSQPGTVGSRFISQDDIDSAKARRDEQWKAAYARSVPRTFQRALDPFVFGVAIADWAKSRRRAPLRMSTTAGALQRSVCSLHPVTAHMR